MSEGSRPFNPTWLTVAAIVLTGVISGTTSSAVNARDIAEIQSRQSATDVRVAAIEKRFAEEQLSTGKALVGLQKDMDQANKTLTSIQQALMMRPSQYSSNANP